MGGRGWAGCSQFVSNADAPFHIQAVDALPGPPVTQSHTVKDYLDWMAGVVKEFGPKASYRVTWGGFDSSTSTALFNAVFMEFSDYVYAIKICPSEMKVCGMSKVWNDQYALAHLPGTSQQQVSLASVQPQGHVSGADSLEMARVSQDFFACCESGRGWAGCSQFVSNADAPFHIQ